MEGKDFLNVARKFCESPHEEERRTAVSRAYYALFNHVKRSLELKGIPVRRNAEAHEQLSIVSRIFRTFHSNPVHPVMPAYSL
jgi:uncharacterized protein (UPF0332 family)